MYRAAPEPGSMSFDRTSTPGPDGGPEDGVYLLVVHDEAAEGGIDLTGRGRTAPPLPADVADVVRRDAAAVKRLWATTRAHSR